MKNVIAKLLKQAWKNYYEMCTQNHLFENYYRK